MFAERIKELAGEPITEPAGKARKAKRLSQSFHLTQNWRMTQSTLITNSFWSAEKTATALVRNFLKRLSMKQTHFNYFDTVSEHIETLGDTYLAKIAGTPSTTGLQTQGFVARQGAAITQGPA